MGNQFNPEKYFKYLYAALENQYRNDPEWTEWNKDRLFFMRQLISNPNPKELPDACFLSTLCAIHRNDQSQFKLASTVMNHFLNEYRGDLRNIQTNGACKKLGLYPRLVPYQWITNLASHLRKENISFAEFLHNMDGLSGLEIREELKSVIGAQSDNVKRISIFIRDFLEKDAFGIDQNVREVLNNVGLPVDENKLIIYSRKAGIDPGRLERLFYLHGKRMCQSKNCNICPINTNCRDYRFNI